MAIIRHGFNRKQSVIPPLELIEYWLAVEFNYRANVIVPNISYGIWEIGHECDLLILRPSGYAVEIEIKRSFADLKADAKKTHGHRSAFIRELWFCIYDKWDYDECLKWVPEGAGVLTYGTTEDSGCWPKILRRKSPTVNRNARRFGEYNRAKLLHLAHMRIWGMKKKIWQKGAA